MAQPAVFAAVGAGLGVRDPGARKYAVGSFPQPMESRRRSAGEFIRVMGLLYIGTGRREYYTIVTGIGLLRDNLMAQMMEETGRVDSGGILHLSKGIRRKTWVFSTIHRFRALKRKRPPQNEGL